VAIGSIVCGYREPGAFSQADLGDVEFGGCVVTLDNKDTACPGGAARWTSR